MYITLFRDRALTGSSPVVKLRNVRNGVHVDVTFKGTCTAGEVKLWSVSKGYDARGATQAEHQNLIETVGYVENGSVRIEIKEVLYGIMAEVSDAIVDGTVSVDVVM